MRGLNTNAQELGRFVDPSAYRRKCGKKTVRCRTGISRWIPIFFAILQDAYSIQIVDGPGDMGKRPIYLQCFLANACQLS